MFVPRAGSVWPFDALRLGARCGDEVLVSSTGHDAGEVVREIPASELAIIFGTLFDRTMRMLELSSALLEGERREAAM